MSFIFRKPKGIVRKQSRSTQKVLEKLQSFLENETGDVEKLLCGFWKDQGDALTYQEIRNVILAGALSEELLAAWRSDYSVLVRKKMGSVWKSAMEAGSRSPEILENVPFHFSTHTPGVINWIKERGASFVTACTEEQGKAIQALLSKKMVESHTVDELSRMIRPCIGLTEGQAAANAKFYDHIRSSLKKKHPKMKPESIRKKALEASTKYAERQHRQRAMTIAQTELAFAYNKGADESVRQGQEHNLLGTVVKIWSTSGDIRVCDICRALDGVEIGMDDEFDFKGKVLYEGQKQTPPAHPRCACAVQYIEKEPPKFDTYTQNMDNKDFLIRSHVPGENTVEERMAVTEVISESPAKVQEAMQATTIDVGKKGASQYDYNHDILYIAKGAGKDDIIHEIGHMVESKLVDKMAIKELTKSMFSSVTAKDVAYKPFMDRADNTYSIPCVEHSGLVSEYQGRIYVDSIDDAFDADGKLKTKLMWEIVSEGYREFMENPARLKQLNKALYHLIKEAVE